LNSSFIGIPPPKKTICGSVIPIFTDGKFLKSLKKIMQRELFFKIEKEESFLLLSTLSVEGATFQTATRNHFFLKLLKRPLVF